MYWITIYTLTILPLLNFKHWVQSARWHTIEKRLITFLSIFADFVAVTYLDWHWQSPTSPKSILIAIRIFFGYQNAVGKITSHLKSSWRGHGFDNVSDEWTGPRTSPRLPNLKTNSPWKVTSWKGTFSKLSWLGILIRRPPDFHFVGGKREFGKSLSTITSIFSLICLAKY